MKQVVIAATAGAIVYFVWQMMAWMVLPIHGPTVKGLPDEDAVRNALKAQNLETGVYVTPYGSNEEMADPDSAFNRNHQAGPIFSIYYHQDGAQPIPPSVLAIGFITDFLGALIVALLLTCASGCCTEFWKRVGFVTAFGIFLALMAHVSYFNWMRFPMHYTMMFIVDAVVGWFLVGLVMATIIKPTKVGEAQA